MLILASASDKLQIVTGSAGHINVHASFLDNVSGSVNPGRQNSRIAIAGISDVVNSPLGGVFRNLKTLHVYNAGASANDVTVRHTDGTTIVELHKVTLGVGQTLQYIDEIGFLLADVQQPGAFVLIDSKTVTTPVPTVEFRSGLDATFDQFVFRIFNVRFNLVNWIYMRISRDGGTTWKQEPGSYHSQWIYSSAAYSPPLAFNSVDNKMQIANAMPIESYRHGNQYNIQFVRPWEAGFRHLFMADTVAIQDSDGLVRSMWAGEYWGPDAVDYGLSAFNAIQFLPYVADNFIAGTFNLYGIKK